MNREELHNLLVAEDFDQRAFDVLGAELHPPPGDIYILRSVRSGVIGKPDYWITYYSERGEARGLRQFASEAEACSFFLSEIRRDPLTSIDC